MNCQDVETKVGIMCDNDNGINQCDYKEKPMNDDNGDDVCFVEGSFDATDIIMDPARPGVCQLNFVALKDSCKAEALPVGFGIKAEVDMTAGPDDTSTMLLWFSTNEGVVYYNEDEPREPVFLHHELPQGRKLGGCSTCDPKFQICTCDPKFPNNCGDDYCATESEWEDGCAKCLCYEKGNGSWCDGTNNVHYDNYFDQHGENPWGDRNRENRKCNEVFPSLYNPWFGPTKTKENICHYDWQCASGLKCLSIWEDGKNSYCVEPPQEKGRKAGEIAVGKKCDPQWPNSCKNGNCAGVAGSEWEDGCAACMCYNEGNHAWCDGTRNEYYDKYFDEHDENPYGFKGEENRKCNPKFKFNGQECWWNWQCGNGQNCGWYWGNDGHSYKCMYSW